MTVPESVEVEWGGDSAYVYVLTEPVPEHKFERKSISTGLSDGINIQVKGGVDADNRCAAVKFQGNDYEKDAFYPFTYALWPLTVP